MQYTDVGQTVSKGRERAKSAFRRVSRWVCFRPIADLGGQRSEWRQSAQIRHDANANHADAASKSTRLT